MFLHFPAGIKLESYSFKRGGCGSRGRGLVRLSLKNVFMDKNY